MRLLLIRVLTTLLLSSPALSASVIITHAGTNTVGPSSDNNTLGFDFTVGPSDILITALGVWDEGSDGLVNSHTVAVWNSLGAVLGLVAVPAGTTTPLENEFRFVDLTTPVVLSARQRYVLGASYLVREPDRVSVAVGPSLTGFDPAVISGRPRWQEGLGFAYPSLIGDPGATVGPNAQFTVIPEASVVLFLALAAASFIYPRRSCKGAYSV